MGNGSSDRRRLIDAPLSSISLFPPHTNAIYSSSSRAKQRQQQHTVVPFLHAWLTNPSVRQPFFSFFWVVYYWKLHATRVKGLRERGNCSYTKNPTLSSCNTLNLIFFSFNKISRKFSENKKKEREFNTKRPFPFSRHEQHATTVKSTLLLYSFFFLIKKREILNGSNF